MARRMRRNLDSSGGLIVGEAVMMGLAPVVGRNAAHDIVYAACKDSIEQKTTLYDQLVRIEGVTSRMSRADLRALCEPVNYLGASQRMVDEVVRRQPLYTKAKGAKSNGVKANGTAVNGNGYANGH